jgi:protein BCP1
VDFVFLDPNVNQQSSVKMLINGYLDGLSFRSTELADLIVKQAELGTMVGTEDNDEDEPEYKK